MSSHPWNASLLDSLTGGLTPVQAAALALQTGSADNVYLNMFASSAVQSLGSGGDNASTPSAVDAALTALLLAHAPPAGTVGPSAATAGYGAPFASSSMPLLQPARGTGYHGGPGIDAAAYEAMQGGVMSGTMAMDVSMHVSAPALSGPQPQYTEQRGWHVSSVAPPSYASYPSMHPPMDDARGGQGQGGAAGLPYAHHTATAVQHHQQQHAAGKGSAGPGAHGMGAHPARIRAPAQTQAGYASVHAAPSQDRSSTTQEHQEQLQADTASTRRRGAPKSKGKERAQEAPSDVQTEAGPAEQGVQGAWSGGRISGRKRKIRTPGERDEGERDTPVARRNSTSAQARVQQNGRGEAAAGVAGSGTSTSSTPADETVHVHGHGMETQGVAGGRAGDSIAEGSAAKKNGSKSSFKGAGTATSVPAAESSSAGASAGSVVGLQATGAADTTLQVHRQGPASLHNKKKAWTADEDATLRSVVSKLEEETKGSAKPMPIPWATIDKHNLIPGRNSKQCRDRWVQHLKSDILKAAWTEAEDLLLYQQIQLHGTHWSEIQKSFPGRTDHDIKNHFYATKRRLARRQQRERQEEGDQEGEDEEQG